MGSTEPVTAVPGLTFPFIWKARHALKMQICLIYFSNMHERYSAVVVGQCTCLCVYWYMLCNVDVCAFARHEYIHKLSQFANTFYTASISMILSSASLNGFCFLVWFLPPLSCLQPFLIASVSSFAFFQHYMVLLLQMASVTPSGLHILLPSSSWLQFAPLPDLTHLDLRLPSKDSISHLIFDFPRLPSSPPPGLRLPCVTSYLVHLLSASP